MIDVLVVDDSAVVRQAMSSLLSPQHGVRVTVASDPIIAMAKMKARRPDVVMLDLEMPRMDGLTFLRNIMSSDPIPVIVCSGLAAKGSQVALTALAEGAVEIITKPTFGVAGFLDEQRANILHAIRAAAQSRPRLPLPRFEPLTRLDRTAAARPALEITTSKVIALGASTGGTEALRIVLERMPPDCAGIVVVQHMPEQFTRAFANRLDQCCTIAVREASDGERIMPGLALIAPGNRHLEVSRSGAHYVVRLSDAPPVSRHRPSVDVLFHSVAQAAGANAAAAILTGMGDDGAEGLLEMRRAGAMTIAQDEASCVVFGMPKEAIARGAVERVLPLGKIAATLAMDHGTIARALPV